MIEPALTAEEWAAGMCGGAYEEPPLLFEIGAGDRVLIWENGSYVKVLRPRALAALCLHGQGYGFTWEDVDRLRRLSELRVCYGMGDYGPPDMYDGGWITMLADRIGALLPPREPQYGASVLEQPLWEGGPTIDEAQREINREKVAELDMLSKRRPPREP